jgi:hypothetical protein
MEIMSKITTEDYESNDYELTINDYNDAMESAHYWSTLHAYAELMVEHGRKQVSEDVNVIINKIIKRIVSDDNGF